MIKDANILLSVVNTALRDKYRSLEEYAREEDVSVDEILNILESIGYYYDENANSFKLKALSQ